MASENIRTIEIYASMECPYAYLMAFRLCQLWPELEGKVQITWRALSLEYINQRATAMADIEEEKELFRRIEPNLPLTDWNRPAWEWPATLWPAFEALACAQTQGPEVGFAMSWALRHAFFFQGRCVSLRHELLDIAEEAASVSTLDVQRFTADWDSGRYKDTVIAECRRGWHDLKIDGSATMILPGGRQFTNPAIGRVEYAAGHFKDYHPPQRDPLEVYREILLNGY